MDEDELRLDVARVLHTMFCHCGGEMSEPPFKTSWTGPAQAVIDTLKEKYDIKLKEVGVANGTGANTG